MLGYFSLSHREGLHYFDRNGRYFDRNAISTGTWIAILIGKRERAILIGTCIVRGAYRLLQTPDLATRGGPTDQTPIPAGCLNRNRSAVSTQHEHASAAQYRESLDSENLGTGPGLLRK